MKLSAKRWASLYGVRHHNRRDGLCDYTAIITGPTGKQLLIPGLRFPFGPTLKEALRDHAMAARVAEGFQGDFAAYRAKQGHHTSRKALVRKFAPCLRAWIDLYEILGREAARVLILQVYP